MATRTPSLRPSLELAAVQCVGLVGVGSLVSGVHQIHAPSAFIVGGLLGVAWAVLKSMGRP